LVGYGKVIRCFGVISEQLLRNIYFNFHAEAQDPIITSKVKLIGGPGTYPRKYGQADIFVTTNTGCQVYKIILVVTILQPG
jgi:hypothetical protein